MQTKQPSLKQVDRPVKMTHLNRELHYNLSLSVRTKSFVSTVSSLSADSQSLSEAFTLSNFSNYDGEDIPGEEELSPEEKDLKEWLSNRKAVQRRKSKLQRLSFRRKRSSAPPSLLSRRVQSLCKDTTPKLFGRVKEERILRDMYCHRAERPESSVSIVESALVCVQAAPGSGKSTLVEQTLKPMVERDNGYFVVARFRHESTVDDDSKSRENFSHGTPRGTSILCDALFDLCDLVIRGPMELQHSIGAAIVGALGLETARLLSHYVCNLSYLIALGEYDYGMLWFRIAKI